MTQIVPLSKETHRSLKVDGARLGRLRRQSALRAGDRQRVSRCSSCTTPSCSRRTRTRASSTAAPCSASRRGRTCSCGNGEDREFYRPLGLQRVPFYAQGPEVAIDLDHPRVGAEGGKALFTDYGEPTRYLQRIIWAFQDLKPGIETTRFFRRAAAGVEAHRADRHRGGVRRRLDAQVRRPVHREPGGPEPLARSGGAWSCSGAATCGSSTS